MSDYLIKYRAIGKDGFILKQGEMLVKNKVSKFEAQCKFEEYLKRKYPFFDRLIVDSCTEDFMGLFRNSGLFN